MWVDLMVYYLVDHWVSSLVGSKADPKAYHLAAQLGDLTVES